MWTMLNWSQLRLCVSAWNLAFHFDRVCVCRRVPPCLSALRCVTGYFVCRGRKRPKPVFQSVSPKEARNHLIRTNFNRTPRVPLSILRVLQVSVLLNTSRCSVRTPIFSPSVRLKGEESSLSKDAVSLSQPAEQRLRVG